MISVGTEVGWLWTGSLATAGVTEVHPNRHEIITKGKRIVCNGIADDLPF